MSAAMVTFAGQSYPSVHNNSRAWLVPSLGHRKEIVMAPLIRALVIAALVALAVPWLAAGCKRVLNPVFVTQYVEYSAWVSTVTR